MMKWAALAAFLLLTVYAFADECNPDLVSDRTPLCQLLKPQYRQCRPDRDINHDFDLLDGLCSPCPAGQCVTGVDPDTLALACSPCGCTGGGSCTPITCDPGFVLTAVDSGCGFTCTPLCEVCTAAGIPSCSCATTTTTEAPTTTTETTTTTTTSTTTTTIGPSVTFLWVPLDPNNGVAQNAATPADTLQCDTWVPSEGIVGVDRLSFEVLGSSGTPHLGVAIYNADGSAQIASTGGVSVVGGVNSVTGLSFSVTAGTEYQVCHCTENTGVGLSVMVGASDVSGAVTAIANTLSVPGSSVAANSCATGNPPGTTGALGADSHIGMIELLLSTTTP